MFYTYICMCVYIYTYMLSADNIYILSAHVKSCVHFVLPEMFNVAGFFLNITLHLRYSMLASIIKRFEAMKCALNYMVLKRTVIAAD